MKEQKKSYAILIGTLIHRAMAACFQGDRQELVKARAEIAELKRRMAESARVLNEGEGS
jgi:hypothetical protein